MKQQRQSNLTFEDRLDLTMSGRQTNEIGIAVELLNRHFKIDERTLIAALRLNEATMPRFGKHPWRRQTEKQIVFEILDDLIGKHGMKRPPLEEIVRTFMKALLSPQKFGWLGRQETHALAKFVHDDWENLLIFAEPPEKSDEADPDAAFAELEKFEPKSDKRTTSIVLPR